MTLTKQSAENFFLGDGSTTVFATNIYGTDKTDFKVVLRSLTDENEESLTLGSDYTITNLGAQAGVVITYPISGSPLSSNKRIVIQRKVPYTQTLSLSNVSNFLPEVLEDELDNIVMMVQQLKEISSRTFQYGPTDLGPLFYLKDDATSVSVTAAYPSVFIKENEKPYPSVTMELF